MKKVLLFFAALCIMNFAGYATDFYSQGNTTANTASNWNTATDGSGTTAVAGDFTTSGNTWNIQTDMTLSGNWTIADGSNIVITATGSLSAGTRSITLGGDWTNNGTFTAGTSTVNFTAASTGHTLNGSMTGSNQFYHIRFNNAAGEWSFGANAADVGGNFTLSASAAGGVTAPSTTLKIAGNFARAAACTFNHNSGTIELNGTANQTIPSAATTFHNLHITNTTGTVTATTGTITADNTLTIDAGSVLNMAGIQLLGGFTAANSGTLLTSCNVNPAIPAGQTWGADVIFTRTNGTQEVPQGTYNNLTFNNTSGTNTAVGDLTVNNSLTTTTGTGILNMSTFQLLGTITTLTNNGRIQTSCTANPPIPSGRDWTGTTGLVTFSSTTGGLSIPAGTYKDLTCNNTSGTNTVTGDIDVSGTLTTTGGANGTLDMGTNLLTGTFTPAGLGTLATQNTTATPIPTGKTWTGTVNYNNATGGQTVVSATSYTSLSLGNSSGTSSSPADVVMSGRLTTTAGGTFNLGINTLTGAAITTSGTGTVTTQNSTATPLPTGRTWTCIVDYNATTGAQTIMAGTYSGGLTLDNSSGTSTASGNLVVNSPLTVTNAGATLDMSTFAMSGTLTSITNNGTVKTSNTGATPFTTGKSWGGSGTVEYSVTGGAQTIMAGTYNALAMLNTSGTNTASNDITVNTLLTTTAGGVFSFANTGFQLLGAFTAANSGTIQTICTVSPSIPAGNTWGGTVIVDRTTGTPNIPAGTYNNLTFANTAGTVNVLGDITVNGAFVTTSGGTVNMVANQLLGTLTATHNGTLTTSSTADPAIPSGKDWTGTTGQITYSRTAGGQFIPAGTYKGLTCSNTSGTNTVNGDIDISTAFQVTGNNASAILDMGTNVLTGTFTYSGIGQLHTQNTGATPVPAGNTWTGTVYYDAATGGQTVPFGTYTSLASGNTSGTNTVVGGDISVSGVLTCTAGGILDLGTNVLTSLGTTSGTGTLATQNISANPIPSSEVWAGTVDFNAATGGQTVPAGTYAGLTLDNTSGTTTAGGALSVTTSLTITDPGATLDMGANAMTGTLTTITNNGTITTDNTTAAPFTVGKTFGGSGTVVYNLAIGGQTVVAGTYNNLTLSNSSNTDNAGNDITVNGTLTTTAGGTFLFNNTGYQLLGALTAVNNGTISTVCTINPALPNGITWGGDINFTRTNGGQSVPSGTYNNLSFLNTSGTNTAQGDITVNGALVTTTAGVFAMGANQLLGAITSLTNNGTVSTTSTANPAIPSGKDWTGTTGRVNFLLTTGGQFIPAGTYGYLACSNTSGTNTVTGDIDVSTTFSSTGGASGTTDMGTNLLTGTFTPAGSGVLRTQNTTATPIPSGKTWTGTINYDAVTGGQTVVDGSYVRLTLDNTSGTDNAGGAITVTTGLTITNTGATLSMGVNAMSGGLTTITNNGTIVTDNTSSTPFTVGKTWGGTGSVVYNVSTGGQTVVQGTYNDLLLNNSSGTDDAGNDITVNGTLTTTAGGTFLFNNTGYQLLGTLTASNSGTIQTICTVTPAIPAGATWGGSVIFSNTAGAQEIPQGTFNNLSFLNTSGTQTAQGDVTVNGALVTTSGGTFSMAANQLLGTLSSVTNDGTITTTSTANPPIPAGKDWTGTTGRVNFALSTGGQTIPAGTYGTIVCSNSSGTNNVTGDIDVSTGFTSTGGASGITDMGTNLLTGTFTPAGSGTLQTQNTTATPIPTGKTWTGTVNYNAATGGQTVVQGTYATLEIDNTSGTTSAGGALTVNTRLNMNNAGATLDMSTFAMGGTMTTITNDGTVLTSNTSTTPFTGGRTWNGTGTVIYSLATGGQTVMAGTYANNITLSNSSGTNNASGTITENGTLTTTAGGTLDMLTFQLAGTGTPSHSGLLFTQATSNPAIPSGKTWGGNVTYYRTSGSQTLPLGTFNDLSFTNTSGSISVAGDITVDGALITTSGGTLVMGTNQLLGAMTSVSHGGTITTSCNVNPAIPAGKDWSTGTTGLIQFRSLTGGQFIPLGTYKTLTCTNTSGTNTAVGNITVTGTFTANGNGGTLDMTTFDLAAGTLTNAASGTILTQSTSASPLPSAQTVAGSVTYDNPSGGQTIVSENSYVNLTLSNTSGTNTADGDIVVNGVLTTGAAGTIFDMSTGALSGTLTSIAGAGTINTANTSAAPIKTGQTWPQLLVYNAATGGQTIMNGTYNGGLTNSNASGTNTLAAASAITVNGDLTLSAASVLDDNDRTLTLVGNIVGSGTHNASTSGAIAMTGAAATISDATLGNLTLNNAAGFSLTGDPTINGTLTLTSGLLTIGSNNLYFGTSAPAVAGSPSSANMIVASSTGEVRKLYSATGAFTFPIGDAGPNYTPATIDLTSGTPGGGAYAGMNVTNSKHPANASATDYLNRYWSVSLNNIASPVYSLTGTYVPGDVAGTEASIASASYDGALPWTKYSAVNTGSHFISTTGITAVNVAHSGITGTIPSVDVTPATAAICAGIGQSLVANGTGDPTFTYSWAPSAGLSATTGASVTATQSPTVTTVYEYTVTATDGNGITATATATLTVSPTPDITGNHFLCQADTLTLVASPAGGTWYPDDTSVVYVDTTSGLIYGNGGGTTNVTYTSASGCTAVVEVTVNPAIAPITGLLGQCEGLTTTLSDADGTGTWSSSDITKATIDVNSGLVTAISAASITMSYTIPNGCYTTKPFLVYTQPDPITGTLTLCEGTSTLLTSTSGGSGTWISSDVGVATAGTSSGLITGVTNGTSTITYQIALSGCFEVAEVTVNVTPTAITGGNTICVGTTTTLGSTPSGGTWSSTNTSAATIGSSSGDATGVSGGNTVISYTLSTGCTITQATTINNLPSAITGTLLMCPAGTSTLSSSPGTGAWSSITPAVATISAGGVVSPLTPGNTTISYTLPTGCARTAIVTVDAAPSANTGTAQMCVGGSTTLANGSPGGTWTSSNTGRATVGSATGIVTGVTSGNANITYKVTGDGCYAITEVTVDAAPAAITGTTNACVGATSTLAHITPGGTWSSSNAAIGTVDASSGIVTGISAGTVTITYSISASCISTTTFTVKALPAAITGNFNVCVGTTTPLSDATASGTWSSSNTSIALVHTVTGLTYGISLGNATITYHGTNSCVVTQEVTVNSTASPITGTAVVCAGSTTTLNGTPGGGTWATSNGAIATVGSSSGIVTGVSGGTAIVTYTEPSVGCTVTKTVTVGAAPAAITGTLGLCVGSTTALADATSGGTWTSGSTGVATVGSATGIVTGVSAGNATISYNASGGCVVTAEVTVDAAVSANTGTASVCIGGTTTLSNATGGGAWSTSNAAVGTVDAGTGVVTGIGAGTANITYAVSTACFATTEITVSSTPPAITGTANVCVAATITLSHVSGGGAWSSSNAAIGTVGAGDGIVGGISDGIVTITYDLGGGCIATKDITVSGSPTAISGTLELCEGSGAMLTSVVGGSGTWSSGTPAVATIDATSGLMTGIGSGNSTITYTSGTTGCSVTAEATVDAAPAAITGSTTLCVGGTVTLASATGGGSWQSSNTTAGTVGSSSGIVTGVSAGNTTISYTLGTGCRVTQNVTINPLPAAITGTTSYCVGGTATLSSSPGTGVWSSDNVAATIDGAGLVTSTGVGTSLISYTLGTGCTRTTTVTVIAALSANTGSSTLCVGGTATLANSTGGGTWSSSNNSKATVGVSTGIVSGVATGTSNISYVINSGAGCSSITQVTVNAAPSAISGTVNTCVGETSTLTHGTPGGTWTSSNTGIATVGSSSGDVLGVAAGACYITYTVSSGCYVVTGFFVRALPSAITGATNVCAGYAYTPLSCTPSGGTWISSDAGVALINTLSGVVYGASAGNATITYKGSNNCITTRGMTVDPLPAAITGTFTTAIGGSTTLASATGGGNWTSSDIAKATVGVSSGTVTGVSTGSLKITYTIGTGCYVTQNFTVTASRPGGNVYFAPADKDIVFSVFPNPTTGVFTIDAPARGVFTVYTLDGKKVVDYEITRESTSLSLPYNLAAGAYMCRYVQEDGKVIVLNMTYQP
jgi:trimeric autotransporter adhesin